MLKQQILIQSEYHWEPLEETPNGSLRHL